jgi:hypothetical protein
MRIRSGAAERTQPYDRERRTQVQRRLFDGAGTGTLALGLVALSPDVGEVTRVELGSFATIPLDPR